MMDSSIQIGDAILADYLLICAGISELEQNIIKSSLSDMEFEAVAEALRVQHGHIHERERKPGRRHDEGENYHVPVRSRAAYRSQSNGAPPGKGFGWRRPFVAHAAVAGETPQTPFGSGDTGSIEDDDYDDDEGDTMEGYLCQSSGPEADFQDFEDRIEQDVVACYVAAQADFADPATLEEIAGCVQDEIYAFYSREDARKRGVKVDKYVHGFRPRSELTLAEKRDRVKLVKQKSTCRACGKVGHWHSDPECPAKNQSSATSAPSTSHGQTDGKGKGKGKQYTKNIKYRRSGYLAIADHDKDDIDRERSSSGEMHLQRADPAAHGDMDCIPADTGVPAVRPVFYALDDGSSTDDCEAHMHVGGESSVSEADWDASDQDLEDVSASVRAPRAAAEQDEFEDIAALPPDGQAVQVPVMDFGTYCGDTYRTVAEKETSYYFWGRDQKRPSPQLRRFLEWVDQHYRIDIAARRIKCKITNNIFDATSASGSAASGSANKARLQPRKVYASRARCDECKTFSRAGTNQHQIKLTCIQCGTTTVTTREIKTSLSNPATCEHLNVNHSGSTKTTHRTFCKDCRTTISEEPQEIYRARCAK